MITVKVNLPRTPEFKTLKQELVRSINGDKSERRMGERVGPLPLAPQLNDLRGHVITLKYVSHHYNNARIKDGDLYVDIEFFDPKWENLYKRYPEIFRFYMSGGAIASVGGFYHQRQFRLKYLKSINVKIL